VIQLATELAWANGREDAASACLLHPTDDGSPRGQESGGQLIGVAATSTPVLTRRLHLNRPCTLYGHAAIDGSGDVKVRHA
jgi:hypothetical protein